MSLENQSNLSRSELGGNAYRLLFETGQVLSEIGLVNHVSISADYDVHGYFRLNEGLVPKALGEKAFNGLILHIEAHLDSSSKDFMRYRGRYLDEARYDQSLDAVIADLRTMDPADSLTKTRWDSKRFAELIVKSVEFNI